jgi:glycosyltransferase involved in cell wall biosynthesis
VLNAQGRRRLASAIRWGAVNRICFVLPDSGPSGGVAVASAHARGLAADHGVEADLVTLEQLDGARGRYDVAIATWWETVPALWRLDAARRAVLLQSFEQRFYDRDAPFERLSAEATLAMAVDFIAVSGWMREQLLRLREGARCRVVRPGIDKERFSSSRDVRREGPLRVLIEGQPSLPFKGVADAVAAVGRMSEPVQSTLVALDAGATGDVEVDRVLTGLDADAMADLYRESDVLLKLSRVEGLGLAPVEGFHSGLPCVLTPYTGHDEYARHGENALVVGFDDLGGTAAALDLLARDRDLLARLSEGAHATAAEWPSEKESTRLFHEALGEVGSSEPAQADEPYLFRTLALGTELGRARIHHAASTERALKVAQDLVHELSTSRDECGEMLEDTRAELGRIQSTPAYRLGRAAKRAGRALRRR